MPSDDHRPPPRTSTSYVSQPAGLNLAGSSALFDRSSSPLSRLSSRNTSPAGSRSGSRRSSSSYISPDRPSEPVTAFIPQRLTIGSDSRNDERDRGDDDGDDGVDTDALEADTWRGRSTALNRTRHAWRKSRRRRTAFKVLKDGEGRDSLLHVAHSLVLLLHSSLHFPPPRTYSESILAPGGFLLTRMFPRSMRAQTMQRIYTAAEGLANVRRIVLLARWIQAGTELAMERMASRSSRNPRYLRGGGPGSLLPSSASITATAEDEKVIEADAKEEGMAWLQPQSIAPFDLGAVDAEQQAQQQQRNDRKPTNDSAERSKLFSLSSLRAGVESRLSLLCDSLSVLGEACDVAAFLAGSGIFWRAVGFAELGVLGRRRRKGIERIGVLLSLCSVVLSFALLRIQRLRLRAELRSAHRRIIQANDRIGWASELSGKRIPTGAAISHRKSTSDLQGDDSVSPKEGLTNAPEAITDAPSVGVEEHAEADDTAEREDGRDDEVGPIRLRTYGPGVQEALEDLDDARSSTSSRSTEDPHTLSPTTLLESTERDLLQAETDLAHARHSLVWTFWERIAFAADAVFLAFEAVRPDTDKEGVEAWSGILAGGIRLVKVWDEVKWSK